MRQAPHFTPAISQLMNAILPLLHELIHAMISTNNNPVYILSSLASK